MLAPRYRWFFYKRVKGTGSLGQPLNQVDLVISGFFSKERAKKPIEILDASVSVPEAQYVLRGAYLHRYKTVITSDLFAWCPALNEVVEVLGTPVDDTGEQREIFIYVMDNVEREVDTSTLPTQ